ncbi:MAG: hypothetical protein H7A23_14455 [Leptospiraceae bacterium]|nr:hypothetical protein [Leptospiraceae bacterium]MCP5495753.1 hypothetical protein [Leptospiraceae bacterium]
MAKKLFLLLFFIFLSCISRDGFFDSGECAQYRKDDGQVRNRILFSIVYCASLSEEARRKDLICGAMLFGDIMDDDFGCGEPGIPFPWYKKK